MKNILVQLSDRLNERFTRFADLISETFGKWWFTSLSALALIIWITYGAMSIPQWFTSASWNFPLNTITTVGEWFLEGFILASANRLERRNRELQGMHTELLQAIKDVVSREAQQIEHLEQEVRDE